MAPGTPGAGGGFLRLSADPRGCELPALGLGRGGAVRLPAGVLGLRPCYRCLSKLHTPPCELTLLG